MKIHFPEIKKIFSAKSIIPKIICLFLSIILWAYIGTTKTGEVRFRIPVSFINLPDTLISSNISGRYTTVTLTGKKDILKNVDIKNIKAVVNLEKAEAGMNRSYKIELIKDDIPENINISLSPHEIDLSVERKIYKKIRIKANIIDKVIDGYVLGRIRIFPESVIINGPESRLRNMDYIQTERISVANATERLVRDVSLESRGMPDVSMDVTRVRVAIPVIESADLSEFHKRITLKNTNDKFNYILSQEIVTVYLSSDNTNQRITGEEIDVFVDIGYTDFDEFLSESGENYFEKNYTVDTIIKKDGIKLVSILPEIISIKILEK